MVRRILACLGYRIVYVSEFGVHDTRYDSIDAMMGRPIHKDMSTAPPWARRRVASRLAPPAGSPPPGDNPPD